LAYFISKKYTDNRKPAVRSDTKNVTNILNDPIPARKQTTNENGILKL